MTITEVRTHRLSAPLHSPFRTALRTTNVVDTILVQVCDDSGATGLGEAPQVWRVTGESLASAEAVINEVLSPILRGRDPDDLVRLLSQVRDVVPGNHGAKAAIDVALHDLAARRLGVPLTRLLGGASLRAKTDVTISAGTSEEVCAAAKARVAEGFDVLKMKVGADPAGDLARVRAARQAVGAEPKIRLDANQGWTAREAVRLIKQIEDAGLDIELVEQPVPAADLAGLAWVTERVDTPILADESVFGVGDLLEVIRRRAADMVNVKLAKCGGLSVGRTLLEVAAAAQVGAVVGSMMEGPVGVTAAASLVASCGGAVVSDLDAAWWLESSPLRGGPRYADGWVMLPDAPGLGIELPS